MERIPKGTPNNLTPYISQVAFGQRQKLIIFGNDYPTHDGTAIRDYIHIMDLAEGHIAVLKSVGLKPGLHIYNLGTGKGTSVLEILKIFEIVSGKKIIYEIRSRRPGDVAMCWSNSNKAECELGWKATRTIQEMVRDIWHWQCLNPYGYFKEMHAYNKI